MRSYIPKLEYSVNPYFIYQKLLYLYNDKNEIIDGLYWGEFKAICECPNRQSIINHWIGKNRCKTGRFVYA